MESMSATYCRYGATTAFMQEKGCSPEILVGMPKRLQGLKQGVTYRLHYEGIIAKGRKVPAAKYTGSKVMEWREGPNYARFMSWWRAHHE
jgi:hypothetical protein